jgi:hypothetical protein
VLALGACLADALDAALLDLQLLANKAVVGLLRFGHLLVLQVDDVLLLGREG